MKTRAESSKCLEVESFLYLTVFQPNDLVYTKNFTMSNEVDGVARKLNPLYVGPCRIIAQRGTNDYFIKLSTGEEVQHHVSMDNFDNLST